MADARNFLNKKEPSEQELLSYYQELQLPQTIWNEECRTYKVHYISDMHLDYHFNGSDWKENIKRTVNQLFDYEEMSDVWRASDIFVFNGDLARTKEVIEYFFYRVFIRCNYYPFLEQKKRIRKRISSKECKEEYNKEIALLKDKLQKKLYEIRRVEEEKGTNVADYFFRGEYRKFNEKMSAEKDLPPFFESLIRTTNRIKNHLVYLENNYRDFRKNYVIGKRPIYTMQKLQNVFFVLGNHELSLFDDVETATMEYKALLQKYGVTILQNETVQISNDNKEKLIICGGTGFAKYNEKYNCLTVIGPKAMDRQIEIQQSETFYKSYNEASLLAQESNVPLLVFSHYPVKDWLPEGKEEKHSVFFCGHDHKNRIEFLNSSKIYADNQVGYKKTKYSFKISTLGTVANPYYDMKDSYRETNLNEYRQFYDYLDKPFGDGKLIKALNETTKMYVIRKADFYGFFLISPFKDTTICNGGLLRTVSKIRNIEYYYDNFLKMVSTLVRVLDPLTSLQEKISEWLQKQGLWGSIHGCIVDINFYNHIAVNPFDGNLTFYYSPEFGKVKVYDSFRELLLSDENKEDPTLLEAKNNLPETELAIFNDDKRNLDENKIETIDVKQSIYPLSRRIFSWQKIYDNNILSDWLDEIISISPEVEKQYYLEAQEERKKLRDNPPPVDQEREAILRKMKYQALRRQIRKK